MIKTAINSKDYIDIVKCDDHDIGKMIKMITVMITMIKVITMSMVIRMMIKKNTMIMMIRAIMVMIQVGGNMTAGEADALIRKV